MLQLNAIAPWRLTRPNVGLRPVTPHRVHGDTIDPRVSEPMAKVTSPAATAAAEPAEEPLEPSSRFHGFLVIPPNQTSPIASSPSDSFATSTAPARSSDSTTAASSSSIWSRNAAEPHVVG